MYFYLKEPKSEEETLIYLIYYEVRFKYSTSKKIHPKDWNFDSNLPKNLKGRDDLKKLSLKLSEYSTLLTQLIDNYDINKEDLTKEILKFKFDERFNPERISVESSRIKNNSLLTKSINEFIRSKNESKGVSKTWNRKYNNLKNKILLFECYTKKKYKIKDVNDQWIDKYCGFLRDLPILYESDLDFQKKADNILQDQNIKTPKEGYNDNTLNRHLNFLKTFIKWVVKNHDLKVQLFDNPVKDYEPENIHLTFDEIKLLEKVKLSQPYQDRVRDVFLIGVYSGQRYSDYSVFEKSDIVKTKNGEIIVKKAEKTEQESFIPIVRKLRKILDKYNWDLPKISNQKFNNYIKEVCKIAGINELRKETIYSGNSKKVVRFEKYQGVSSHTARRTFITLSSENGMPDHIIMKITGIKDPKTLMKYKKTSQESVENSMMRIWDS